MCLFGAWYGATEASAIDGFKLRFLTLYGIKRPEIFDMPSVTGTGTRAMIRAHHLDETPAQRLGVLPPKSTLN